MLIINSSQTSTGLQNKQSIIGLGRFGLSLIEELSKENPLLYEHLSAAMRTTAVGDLWPPIKNRKEMKPYYYQFFKNQQK